MVWVACFAAFVASVPPVTMISTRALTRSAASSGNRSGCPSAHRYSMTKSRCHRELNNPHLQELKVPHPSFARRERNVDREREGGRDHRSGTHPTPGGADGRSRALGRDS